MSAIWPKLILKSLTAFGGAVGIVVYKINSDKCYAQPAQSGPRSSGIPWDSNWDGQALQGKRNLFLIRHGEYITNDDSLPLSDRGREQAVATGIKLLELDLPFSRMIHSSMNRAVQTAEIIHSFLPNIPVSVNHYINEGVPSNPDPQVSDWIPTKEQLMEDPPRIECAFRQIVRRVDHDEQHDTYEVIVCHSNVIRYFVCRALQFSPAAWLRITLNNCSITWIVVHPDGRVELKACGDSGHLSRNLLTW